MRAPNRDDPRYAVYLYPAPSDEGEWLIVDGEAQKLRAHDIPALETPLYRRHVELADDCRVNRTVGEVEEEEPDEDLD